MDFNVITDDQLTLIVNSLGVSVIVLIFSYHFWLNAKTTSS